MSIQPIDVTTLPALTGTEKQIAYANDLRSLCLYYINEMFTQETKTGWIILFRYYELAEATVRQMTNEGAYGKEASIALSALEERIHAYAQQLDEQVKAGEIKSRERSAMIRVYRYNESCAVYMDLAKKVLAHETSARFWIDRFARWTRPEDLECGYGKIDSWKEAEERALAKRAANA